MNDDLRAAAQAATPEQVIEFDATVRISAEQLGQARPSEIDALFGALAKVARAALEGKPAPSSMTGGVQSEKEPK